MRGGVNSGVTAAVPAILLSNNNRRICNIHITINQYY